MLVSMTSVADFQIVLLDLLNTTPVIDGQTVDQLDARWLRGHGAPKGADVLILRDDLQRVVRMEADAPLLASLPEGGLMRRAAFGLATAIVRELVIVTGGISGRRICAVVGSGDNGGDALWAATFLRRRGVTAAAVLLKPDRAHKAAL